MSNVDAQATLKTEPTRDGSISSITSISEPDLEPSLQNSAIVPKRKGGRKPIYATSEERKQRNRQAQAAFRERRTEYIKQLEATIKHHEDALQSLQQSHRSAADECLMLRYKNSLLERILLEKGIDIQAELDAKSGSPHTVQATVLPPPAPVQKPPPMQRAILNRHHQAQKRSNPGPVCAVEPGARPGGAVDYDVSSLSPMARPTPPSQRSSPTSASSGFATQGVLTPPGPQSAVQQHHEQRMAPITDYLGHIPFQRSPAHLGPPTPAMFAATTGSESTDVSAANAMAAHLYPAPFQSHIDQLGKLTRSFPPVALV